MSEETGVICEKEHYFEQEHGKEITKEECDRLMEKVDEGDPTSVPGIVIERDIFIKLSGDDRDGICSLLDWDIALNLQALKEGKHPATGCKSGRHNLRHIERNKKIIELLGRESIGLQMLFENEKGIIRNKEDKIIVKIDKEGKTHTHDDNMRTFQQDDHIRPWEE